jgi:hypothetical protein
MGIISFEMGILQGQEWQQEPLVIEKVPDFHVDNISRVLGEESQKTLSSTVNASEKIVPSGKDNKCSLVGSKNSDKYHKIDCSHAKRIKKENQVCFKSIEDAKNKGYQAGSCLK